MWQRGLSLVAALAFAHMLVVLPGQRSQALPQEQDYHVSDYDVQLELMGEGHYRVEEEIHFQFEEGSFSSAYRSIALQDIDSIRAVQVEGIYGSVQSLEHRAEEDTYTIRWKYAPRSYSASFQISYVVEGALYEVDGRNRIEWNAVGDDWSVPVHGVDVAVHLPKGKGWSHGDIQPEPSEEAEVRQSAAGWTVYFHHSALGPGTNYQIEVEFPKLFSGRSPAPPLPWRTIWMGFLGVALGIIPGIRRFIHWSGPGPADNVSDDPPAQSFLEHAFLLKGSIREGKVGIPATLFDLAQRGHVTLRQIEKDLWIGSRTEIAIEVHVQEQEDPLPDLERELLETLNEYDTLRSFGRKQVGTASGFVKDAREKLAENSYFVLHQDRSRRWLYGAGAVGVGAIASPFVLSGWIAGLVTGLLLGGAVGALFAVSRKATRTPEGVRAAGAVKNRVDELRSEIETLRGSDPVAAANQFFDDLPWLLLSDEVDQDWIDQLTEALDEVHGEQGLDVPDWIVDTVDEDSEWTTLSATLFHSHVAVVTATTGSSGGAAAGAAGAGAGAAGGAGGGGGGAG